MPSRRMLAAALVLLAAGCADVAPPASVPTPHGCQEPAAMRLSPFGRAAASQPTPPVEATLAVCDPRALFAEGSEVVLSLAVRLPEATRVRAGVVLPPGVEWTQPIPDLDRPLAGEGGERAFRGVARATAPGEHVLRAWAEIPAWSTNGSRVGGWDFVGVRGDARAAQAFEPACSGAHPDPCGAPRIDVQIEATAERRSRVTARASSDRPIDAVAMFWSGAEFEGGTPRAVRLVPGAPATFEAFVELPEAWIRGDHGGHYQVSFYLYPDPREDFRIHEASAYYEAQSGRVAVRHDRPPN